MTSPRICVIIVNWNGGHYLQRCLTQLSQQSYQPHEVIVLDNASSDGSPQMVAAQFPNVRLIEAGSNLGFAAGNNLAVCHASKDCDWIALLNPDAFPAPDWLQALVNAVQEYRDCAMFGSRLIDANTSILLDGIGDAYHLSGLVWREAHGKPMTANTLQGKEIFSCCAAAALYRRDVFETLGGFDENYFCYVEDVDLGFRYRLLGHRIRYIPDSIVYHIGSALTGRASDFSIYHGHRNLVWTFVKDMPSVLFWALLPLHLALNLFSITYFALQGRSKVIWRAKWDAIKGLPRVWRQRRQLQRMRNTSISSIWHMLNKSLLRR